MTDTIKVPDIGDFKDVPVIEVYVKPGQTIAAEETLITLESDKAAMDVPAPSAGVIGEVKIKVGDRVSAGSVIATFAGAGCGGRHRRQPLRRYPRHRHLLRKAIFMPKCWCIGAGSRRLFRRLPGRGSRQEGRTGRQGADARRGLPERRLHPVEGACCTQPK